MKSVHSPSVRLAALIFCLVAVQQVWAQGGREDLVVRQSSTVLNEIMVAPNHGIPQFLLSKAEGVVIIPNMIKGGFVVGVRHGRGVVLVRDEHRGWQPPQFVTMTGGSVGWQAGIQATDVILVFQTRKSVEGLLSGKFTVGVDAAATAGPVGRQASAGTDLTLKSEIYSYSRSRGLFVGASVDGSSLQIDGLANRNFYASTGLTPNGQQATNTPVLPASAAQLLATIAQYADGANIHPQAAAAYEVPQEAVELNSAMPNPIAPGFGNTPGVDQLRMELAAASNRLGGILDNQWKTYLALPAEVFQQGPHPAPQALKISISRFDQVAGDANYVQLTTRPDFQHVHGLLITYTDALSALAQESGAIQLPPPPESGTTGNSVPATHGMGARGAGNGER